jgi:hypothetical protein
MKESQRSINAREAWPEVSIEARQRSRLAGARTRVFLAILKKAPAFESRLYRRGRHLRLKLGALGCVAAQSRW